MAVINAQSMTINLNVTPRWWKDGVKYQHAFWVLGILGISFIQYLVSRTKKKKNQKILNSLTLHAKSVISVNILLDLNMKNLDFNTV